jgi:hypothetical protein
LRTRLLSLGVAAGVGAIAYYVTRVFLSREPLEPLPKVGSDGVRITEVDSVPAIPSRSHSGS